MPCRVACRARSRRCPARLPSARDRGRPARASRPGGRDRSLPRARRSRLRRAAARQASTQPRGRTTTELGPRTRLRRAARREEELLARGGRGERELERSRSAPRARSGSASPASAFSVSRSSSRSSGSCLGGGGNDRSVSPSTATARKRRCRSALTSRTLTPRNPSAPWLPPSRSPALRADLGADSLDEAGVVDRAGQRVELGELVEVPEHLVGVVDDGLHETSQGREALAPVPRSGWSASRAKSSMNCRRPSARSTRSASQSGAPSRAASSRSRSIRARSRTRHWSRPSTTPARRVTDSHCAIELRRTDRGSPSGASRP